MSKQRIKHCSWMLIFFSLCILLCVRAAQAKTKIVSAQTYQKVQKNPESSHSASSGNETVDGFQYELGDIIASLEFSEAQLKKENAMLRGFLEAMEEVESAKVNAMCEDDRINTGGEGNTRLSKIINSQWQVISEREKMVIALKENIQTLKDNIAKTQEDNTETVIGLKKDIAILKQEKKNLNDSCKLLERKAQLSEEKVMIWERKAASLGLVEPEEDQKENTNSRYNFSMRINSRKKAKPVKKKIRTQGIDRLEKEFAQAQKKLGAIYTQQKLYKEAINAYQKSTAYDTRDAAIYYQMGLLYAQIKKNPQAVTNFKKYLEINPKAENKKKVERMIKMLQ